MRLGIPADRVAYVAEDLAGGYTTGPIAALRSGRLADSGRTLMIAAGAGITVGLAYYLQAPSAVIFDP